MVIYFATSVSPNITVYQSTQMSSFTKESEAEVAQRKLIDPFITQIRAQKSYIGASYSAHRVDLILWKDDRVPLEGMEIPEKIGMAKINVNWQECPKIPATETWTLPIKDFVSGEYYSYGGLGLRVKGWIKKMRVSSYKWFERRFDGTTLYLTTQQRLNYGHQIDSMPIELESSFRIAPWIKTVVVTRQHIDPLAKYNR
jgi:hypothetical protein